MKNFKDFTEAKMTRQHFQMIADVISGLDINVSIKKDIAEKFADALSNTNPGFKRDYFIKAAK